MHLRHSSVSMGGGLSFSRSASRFAPVGPRPFPPLSAIRLLPSAPTPLSTTTSPLGSTWVNAARAAAVSGNQAAIHSTHGSQQASPARQSQRLAPRRTLSLAARGRRAESTGQTPSPRSCPLHSHVGAMFTASCVHRAHINTMTECLAQARDRDLMQQSLTSRSILLTADPSPAGKHH